MKHILNNMSEEEKNSIREQHEGGMKLNTEKFKKLVETKQGDVKEYLSEQWYDGVSRNPDESKIIEYVKKKWGLKNDRYDGIEHNSAYLSITNKDGDELKFNFQKGLFELDVNWSFDPKPIPMKTRFNEFKKWFDSNTK